MYIYRYRANDLIPSLALDIRLVIRIRYYTTHAPGYNESIRWKMPCKSNRMEAQQQHNCNIRKYQFTSMTRVKATQKKQHRIAI